MIENIIDLERNKNYLVIIKTWVVGRNNEAHLIGKFKGFIENTIKIGSFTQREYVNRFNELGRPEPFTVKNLDFDFMYWIPNWDTNNLRDWKPFPQDGLEKYYYRDIDELDLENNYIEIYSLGPSGQLITPTTPPNQVPELSYLISGNDPKTQFSKLPKEATDNIKSFLGGKRKSRRKMRKSRRSRKTRKYKRK